MAHWKLTIQASRRHILEGEREDAERLLEELRQTNPDWNFQQVHLSPARPTDVNPLAREATVDRTIANWRRLPKSP